MSLDDTHAEGTYTEQLSDLEQQLGYSGQWLPVFLEPIVGSGERITFAIAARGDDGETLVKRMVSLHLLRSFFGKKAKYLAEMLDVIELSIAELLQQGVPSAQPQLPLPGFIIGPARRARGRNLEDLVTYGRMSCVSLSAASAELQVGIDVDDDERQTSRWAEKIKAMVIITAQDLAPNFQRSHLTDGAKIPVKYGYYDGRYMAHFGVIRKYSPSTSLYHLNARLWQLASASQDLFGGPESRDLLLARPNLSADTVPLATRNQVRDVIDQLTTEADRHRISVLHTDRVEEASRRLYSESRRLAA